MDHASGLTARRQGIAKLNDWPDKPETTAPPQTILDCCSRPGRCGALRVQVDFIRILGGAHVKAFAGGLIMYGLATSWVGGSGLVLVAIGASIWLFSTITGTINDYRRTVEVLKSAGRSDSEIPRLEIVFMDLALAVCWATPAGWVILAAWDLCSAFNHLIQCATTSRKF